MQEIAPGVHVPNGSRRVLYEGDPRAEDRLALLAEVKEIRSSLSDLRHRLREVGREETLYDFDSHALEAAGALSCAIVHLYTLVGGERSLAAQAERLGDLWSDVEAHPEHYKIESGTSKEAHERRRVATALSRSGKRP